METGNADEEAHRGSTEVILQDGLTQNLQTSNFKNPQTAQKGGQGAQVVGSKLEGSHKTEL